MGTGERELIFGRIRSATTALASKSARPSFTDEQVLRRNAPREGDLWTRFATRMEYMHGHTFTTAAKLAAWLRKEGWMHGYCDAGIWPGIAPAFGEGFSVETAFDRSRVDEYLFGLTLAAGAIAESGSLILKDKSHTPRLAALAPWVHIAAVRREEIHATIPDAVRALGDDPNIIWVTGPSKTGDIESVLVEGMHGPGVQAALLLE